MKKGRFFIPKLVFLTLSDFFFAVFCAICILLVSYLTNEGVFRGLSVICAVIGFSIVRLTVSRPFTAFLFFFVSVIKKILKLIFWILRKIAKPIFWTFDLTLGRIICIIKDRVKKKRERKLYARDAGKEENVTVQKSQAADRGKERILIGRRAEKS
jgi:hypothetical protein